MEAEQTQIETEATKPSLRQRIEVFPRTLLIAVLASLFVLLCLILALIYSQMQSSGLKPERPSPTPDTTNGDGQPIVVTFEELNSNATAYQNKWIQVTGNYFPKDIVICSPQPSNGPNFESVLVFEGLQLNVLGGETTLAIVPVNTEMVVQGIWRLYSGPYGCGKEPPSDAVWYLDIRTVIQPNPIVRGTPSPIEATLPADLLPPGFGTRPTPSDEFIPTPTNTPIPVTVGIETPVVTNTATPNIFVTPTLIGTAAATPTSGLFTRTPTPDPNATATSPVVGTATPTVTGTPPTAVPTNTPSTISTAPPGGYPGVTPFPSPTSGSGYP